jgi:hypothetical protein
LRHPNSRRLPLRHEWTHSPLLYSWERGDGDNQFYEITEAEANEIVSRIRGTVTGHS